MDNRQFKKPYKRQFVSSKQYDHFKTLGASPLPQFPSTLRAPSYIDTQTAQNCTAYSGVKERFGVMGKKYDPEKQWQAELKISGTDGSNGITIDVKMQTGLAKNFGFVPVGFTDPTDGALAYFWVQQQSGLDWFDSIRLAMFQLYQKYGKVIPVTVGVNWYSDWDNTLNGILTDNPKTLLGGHDIEIDGFEFYQGSFSYPDWYLDLPGTWGEGYGDRGLFRVDRTVFNKYFVGFGAAYWLDDPNLVPAKLNLLVTLMQNLIVLYKRLISQNNTNGFPPPPSPDNQSIYNFDTPESARHSVRVICDEQGLPLERNIHINGQLYQLKDILCACIDLESGFMNYRPDKTPVSHQNKNSSGQVTSTDWGICQVNDFFHIGIRKDFPTVEYVLNNPDKVVRWMANLFKAGKANLWSSYVSGEYKRFLK